MSTVANFMTRGVRTMRPDDNLVAASKAMEELNIGAVPVCEGERLVGMVTDRDIIVRGVAQELDLRKCKLSDVMSAHVRTVRDDDDVQIGMPIWWASSLWATSPPSRRTMKRRPSNRWVNP
jgi:CBS domain-containing protein